MVNAHGFDSNLYAGTGGNNQAIQLVVDGLKLQSCNPTFLDARDAILAADRVNNGGANRCRIWQGIAKRGMGVRANDGGSSNSLNVSEAFDLPTECTSCGNGVCETGDEEDCLSCPSDCNDKQIGKPQNRFCCGEGRGENPIPCSNNLFTTGGFSCITEVQTGDFLLWRLSCDTGESSSNCSLDCSATPAEVCTGGADEDGDGLTDCADPDCFSGLACTSCSFVEESCSVYADCCSGNCSKGKPSDRVCLP